MGLSKNHRDLYDSLSIAISIAEVVEGKILHTFVSSKFCEDFNINKEQAILNLNEKSKDYLFDIDKFWINEIESQIINGEINKKSVFIRFILNEEIRIVNINIKEEKDNLFYTYTNITNNNSDYDEYLELLFNQHKKIAKQSKNPIIVVSKEDYSVIYINEEARKLVDEVDYTKEKKKCYQLLNQKDLCFNLCPLKDVKKNNLESYLRENKQKCNLNIAICDLESVSNKKIKNTVEELSKDFEDDYLNNIFNSLVDYKKKTYLELMSLFCFDIETKKLVFDYQLNEDFDLRNKNANEVFQFFYSNIVFEEEKEKFYDFFDFDTMVNKIKTSTKSTDSIIYHIDFFGFTKIIKATYNYLANEKTGKEYIIVNAYDITERVESQMMLNAIISFQNEFVARHDEKAKAIIIYSRENNFLDFPVGFSRYSYKDFEDHVHKKIDVVENFGDERIKTCEGRTFLKQGKFYSTTYAVRVNGEILYKRNQSFRDQDNNLYTVVFDVTSIAKTDKEKNANLEKINSQLELAKKEADKANQEKSDFLSRMSHDMRTPLGAIISLSNFGVEECYNQYFTNIYKQINESGEYLLSLVNDILDFQKIENQSFTLNKTVIIYGELSNTVYNIVKSKAEEKHITFNYTKNKLVETQYLSLDQKRTKQILINILNNAIKYTPNGGKVDWVYTLKENEKGEVFSIHTISDNGVGMSSTFQKKMFEPFSTEKNELTFIEGGTGLGLAISKKLVDSMGGTITCESTVGFGTKFTITLPREIPDKEKIENYFRDLSLSNKNIDFEGKSILICEDIKINQAILEKLLLKKNASLTIANNGMEGVSLYKQNPDKFDLVLMDIRMPILNGLESAKEIRKIDKKVPIIALSANAFSDDIKRSLDAGMNSHIAKPIKKDELYFQLKKFL